MDLKDCRKVTFFLQECIYIYINTHIGKIFLWGRDIFMGEGGLGVGTVSAYERNLPKRRRPILLLEGHLWIQT